MLLLLLAHVQGERKAEAERAEIKRLKALIEQKDRCVCGGGSVWGSVGGFGVCMCVRVCRCSLTNDGQCKDVEGTVRMFAVAAVVSLVQCTANVGTCTLCVTKCFPSSQPV